MASTGTLVLEGVVIAQPLSPLLARYGITSHADLPPHGHGLGACDVTIAAGRIAQISPSTAAAPLSASYADVPLATTTTPPPPPPPRRAASPCTIALPGPA